MTNGIPEKLELNFMKITWRFIQRMALIITAVYGLSQIVEKVTAPRAKLIAEVEYSRFVLPPTVKQEPEMGVSDSEKAYARLEKAYAQLFDYRWQGTWFVSVVNKGKQRCASVSLTLPATILATIEKRGREPEVLSETEVIPLGEIRPGERISVVAWTSTTPYEYLARSIQLSYDAGLGAVVVKTPVSPFWNWMAKNWFFALIILPLLVIQMALAALTFPGIPRKSFKKNRRHSN